MKQKIIARLKKAIKLKKEYEAELEKRNRFYIGGCIDCDMNQNDHNGPCYNHNAVEDWENVIRLGKRTLRVLEKNKKEISKTSVKKFFTQFKKELDFYEGPLAYRAFK